MEAGFSDSVWNAGEFVGILALYAFMVRFLGILAVALGGGALGAFGLYVGRKLSRYRLHHESEESQSLFCKNRLD
jgi:hypothetical protein